MMVILEFGVLEWEGILDTLIKAKLYDTAEYLRERANLKVAAPPSQVEPLYADVRLTNAVDAVVYVGSRLNLLAESLTIEHRVSPQDYDVSNILPADWKAAEAELRAALTALPELRGPR